MGLRSGEKSYPRLRVRSRANRALDVVPQHVHCRLPCPYLILLRPQKAIARWPLKVQV